MLASEYSTVALDRGVDTPEWRTVEARERAAAVADTGCRSEMHTRAMEILTPIVTKWEQTHASELEVERQTWQSFESAAEDAWPEFVAANPQGS